MDIKHLKKKSFTSMAIILLGSSIAGAGGYNLISNVLSAQPAQANNISDHNGYWNINDFGARANDPNFDNAKVFNQLISKAGKQGGTIYIPTGTYYVKSPITIDRSYISIVGDNSGLRSGIDPEDAKSQAGGGGAQIVLSSGITGFKIRGDNARLSGVTFKGFQIKGQGNNGFGIKGETDTDGVTIADMVINNVGMGVELKGADAASIHDNWIAETQSCVKLSGSSQQANIANNSMGGQPKGVTLDLENPDRYTISGNNFYPDGSAVINLYNPVHGTITGNTISSYYNGVINMLPNSRGNLGNSNVISSNVISVEDWKKNPAGKDSKWGILHIEGYTNRIDGNSIIANNAPENYSGVLIMKGDNNRLDGNSIGLGGVRSNAKVIMNGSANNNKVTDTVDNSEFDNGGNNSNSNK
ncbi:NosD domain-containing protein [Ligilactobacillus faecis]|uniref:NosD domain-containing protein n=1 Tax=Ligilactobacillus faecis TaxID=762833 RepID=A0ABV4DR29_9LACO